MIDPVLEPPEAPVETSWDIVRAAYCELGVVDLEASRRFYVETLGFVLSEESADALYLRGYEEAVHHSLALVRAPAAALRCLAFRVRRDEDLDRVGAHLAGLGCPVRERAPGESPAVGRAVRARDPLGFTVELFHEIEPAERLLQRFDLHRGGHVMRIDHFNVLVPDVEAAYEHYRRLGFRTTELIADDAPDGRKYGVWLTRKPFVHDVALTGGTGPRLHHLGFTVADPQAVLRACDILGATHQEARIERGPGRHGVSNAFYVYLRDPDSHRIELYTGDYYTGDPDLRALRWSVHDARRRSFWGHSVPRSWYEEGSLAADLDGELVPLVEVGSAERAIVEAAQAAVH